MAFLQICQLTKIYPDGTEAVRGIDLGCAEGEFVVLLGPSGCGKTTTLRMIAGLEQPSAGRIEVGGEETTFLPPGQRDVGFVFQFYALYPHLSVRDNIAFPLECSGLESAQCRDRVDEILQRLKLVNLEPYFPHQLSGGDQQRVALARAMVRRPRLYLMDEPLGTLDADRRLEMRELVRAQQLASGVTTIYVTHDQEEAMSLADRVVVMEGGKIRQIGSPAQVYQQPADLFVAHFIGSPGMNFIEGAVEDKPGECLFVSGELVLELEVRVRPGPVVLGIRPEFVHFGPQGVLSGEVLLDEYMGASRNIHVDTGAGRLVLRGEGEQAFVPGEQLPLLFDPQGLRFFDPLSGECIA